MVLQTRSRGCDHSLFPFAYAPECTICLREGDVQLSRLDTVPFLGGSLVTCTAGRTQEGEQGGDRRWTGFMGGPLAPRPLCSSRVPGFAVGDHNTDIIHSRRSLDRASSKDISGNVLLFVYSQEVVYLFFLSCLSSLVAIYLEARQNILRF